MELFAFISRSLWACVVLTLLTCSLGCRPQLQPDTRSGLLIPARITSPQARLDYAIAHYWDKSPQWHSDQAEELKLWIRDYSGLISGQAAHKVRRPLLQSLDYIPSELIPLTLASYRAALCDSTSLLYDTKSYALLLLWARQSPKLDSAQQHEALEELRLLYKQWTAPLRRDSLPIDSLDSLSQGASLSSPAPQVQR